MINLRHQKGIEDVDGYDSGTKVAAVTTADFFADDLEIPTCAMVLMIGVCADAAVKIRLKHVNGSNTNMVANNDTVLTANAPIYFSLPVRPGQTWNLSASGAANLTMLEVRTADDGT